MVATERFGAGVLGAQSKEDIKLDYVIVGSWLLGILVGIYYIYVRIYKSKIQAPIPLDFWIFRK